MKEMRYLRTVLLVIILVVVTILGGCTEKKVESSYTGLKLDDYIVIPDDYLKFEYEKPTGIEISEKEIESAINIELQEAAIETEEKEGITQIGDKLYISYVAEDPNGEGISKSDGYYITLGKDYLKEELQDALLGHNVGDVVEVKTRISDDFLNDESLRGQSVTYKITIEKKYKVIVPELDDDFVKTHSNASTVEEYRKQVKQQLFDSKYEDLMNEIYSDKWDSIVEESEVIKYPPDMIDAEVEYFQGYVNYAGYSSMDLDFEQLGNEYAEDAVKQKLVLYKISEDNDLIPTEKEFQAYATAQIESKGYDEESFKSVFVYDSYEYGIKFGWLEDYLNEQVKKLIMGL